MSVERVLKKLRTKIAKSSMDERDDLPHQAFGKPTYQKYVDEARRAANAAKKSRISVGMPSVLKPDTITFRESNPDGNVVWADIEVKFNKPLSQRDAKIVSTTRRPTATDGMNYSEAAEYRRSH